MLKPVDYQSEKCRVIEHWKKKVLDPMDGIKKVNRAYLIGAIAICELCIKDIIEQTLGIFIPPTKDGENNSYLNLLREHDIVFLNNKLYQLSNGEYDFPKLCNELDGHDIVERALYADINLDVDKDTLKCTVEAYMRRHTELLEDYEQRWHKLKLSIEKW